LIANSQFTPAAPLAAAIFLATIGLVIARPWRLTEATAALLGASAMVLMGLVSPSGAASDVAGHWNVLLFFVGLTGAAAVAERSGLFDALAGTSARLSGGSPRRLLVAVVGAGAIVAAVLSNDAAALVLTPVVYVLVARFGLSPLPYVLACTFVADAASIALPVSNPVNVIVSDRLGVSAASLVPVMLPAAARPWSRCSAAFRDLPQPASGASAARAAPRPWASWTGEFRDGSWPLRGRGRRLRGRFGAGPAARADDGGRVAAAARRRVDEPASDRPLDGIGWSLLVFVAAMGILVDGLSSAGITAWLAQIVLGQVRDSPAAVMVVTAFAAAVGSNLVNNLPAAFVFADAVHGAGLSAASAHAAAIGTIIGADLGPNLTPVGSVATLLWFVLLRQRGLEVSTWSYIRIGLIVTPVTILAALGVALLLGVPR
jgi:arsenical pump membrane protein